MKNKLILTLLRMPESELRTRLKEMLSFTKNLRMRCVRSFSSPLNIIKCEARSDEGSLLNGRIFCEIRQSGTGSQ